MRKTIYLYQQKLLRHDWTTKEKLYARFLYRIALRQSAAPLPHVSNFKIPDFLSLRDMAALCLVIRLFKQHKIRTLHRNRELRMWSVNLMREKAIKIVGSQGGKGEFDTDHAAGIIHS